VRRIGKMKTTHRWPSGSHVSYLLFPPQIEVRASMPGWWFSPSPVEPIVKNSGLTDIHKYGVPTILFQTLCTLFHRRGVHEVLCVSWSSFHKPPACEAKSNPHRDHILPRNPTRSPQHLGLVLEDLLCLLRLVRLVGLVRLDHQVTPFRLGCLSLQGRLAHLVGRYSLVGPVHHEVPPR